MESSVAPRSRWRRWLRSIHLYGGLLCSSYLVVYGISSLLFSHPIGRFQREGPLREWQDTVQASVNRDDAAQSADQIARELGLVGRVAAPPKWSDTTGLSFEISRPGYQYVVHADPDGGVKIAGRTRGIATVFKGLHDARRYPGSVPLTMWWNYTHITVIVMLFSTISGIVLWFGSRRFTASGWGMLAGGSVFALLLMGWLVS